MGQPVGRAFPPEVLLLPSLAPQVDREGWPVGEVRAYLLRTPEGGTVAPAYTSPERLVRAHGERQPWVAVRTAELAALFQRHGVDLLLVDGGSPDGYAVAPDGTITPLAELAKQQRQQGMPEGGNG